MGTITFARYRNFVKILSFKKKFSNNFKPEHVKDSDFLSILYSKTLREYRKPKKNWIKNSHLMEWIALPKLLQVTLYAEIIWIFIRLLP